MLSLVRNYLISIIFIVLGALILVVSSKERGVQDCAQDINAFISKELEDVSEWSKELQAGKPLSQTSLPDKHFNALEFEGDSLVYWTSNLVSLSPTQLDLLSDQAKLLQLRNGWFLSWGFENGDRRVAILLPIKYQYSISNQYLKEEFHPKLNIPDDFDLRAWIENSPQWSADIMIGETPAAHLIGRDFRSSESWWPIGLALIMFGILLGVLAFGSNCKSVFQDRPWQGIFIFWIGLVVLRGLILVIDFPGAYLQGDLFDPGVFAIPILATSLWELVLHACFAFVGVFFAFRRIEDLPNYNNPIPPFAFFPLLGILAVLIFAVCEKVVLNSTIELDISNFSLLDHNSFIALICILTFWTSFGLFLLLRRSDRTFSLKDPILWITILVTVILTMGAIWLLGFHWSTGALILLWLLLFVSASNSVNRADRHIWSYGITIAWLMILALPAAFALYSGNVKKQKELQDVYAERQLENRDWYFELALETASQQIKDDTYLKAIYTNPYITAKELKKRLTNLYLTGVFSRYDIEILPYNVNGYQIKSTGDVGLQSFKDQALQFGENTVSPFFYYVDPPGVSYSYLGFIPVKDSTDNYGEIVIQFSPKQFLSNNVYPELLEQGSSKKLSIEEQFSFIVLDEYMIESQDGEIHLDYIPLVDSFLSTDLTQFEAIDSKYRLLMVKGANGKVAVVEAPKFQAKVIITYFSYLASLLLLLYVLFFIARFLYLVFKKRESFSRLKRLSLRSRVSLALVSVVLLSFFVIGLVTINYFVDEYDNYHKNRLLRKQQAILIGLEVELGDHMNDSSFYHSNAYEEILQTAVQDLANIHSMDVNVFDLEGKIIASSQPTIFEEGLISSYMDPFAYRHFQVSRRQYIQQESIGLLSFQSVYAPLITEGERILGIVNIPYFARQRNLNRDISSFMVTLVNAYVALIIITGLMALFISRSVNRSLGQIAERLGKVKISGQNEPIPVEADDEIGKLINEYNHMIFELEESARKLAETERELAWREMAKQIAHEIKNPLTPMKLSIQHLQRAIKDNDPNATELADRVSKTLIEQIENLSAIATAFSSFAKMPAPVNEKFDLSELVEGVVNLFENEEGGLKIDFKIPEDPIMVFLDKNQIVSVLNNLLKNALQAVPDDQTPEIEVFIRRLPGPIAQLEVKDNGTGIPEDFQPKVFVPNFTTKNSGTGLGLAISKKIVQQAKGNIRFDTEEGAGTSFFVEFPMMTDL